MKESHGAAAVLAVWSVVEDGGHGAEVAVNLAAALCEKHQRRIALIDFDPQCRVSKVFMNYDISLHRSVPRAELSKQEPNSNTLNVPVETPIDNESNASVPVLMDPPDWCWAAPYDNVMSTINRARHSQPGVRRRRRRRRPCTCPI